MAQPCFDNIVAQIIHKYANLLTLLLIAMLSWWGSNIETKLNAVVQEQIRRTARIEEVKQLSTELTTLRIQFGGLEAINRALKVHEEALKRIENRLDSLISRKQVRESDL